MARKLLSATSALALAVTQFSGPVVATSLLGGALVLSLSTMAQAQDLQGAKEAVERAKAALEEAKANGEGVKEARQALKAAREERKRIRAEMQAAKKAEEAERAAAQEAENQQREAEARAAEEEAAQREAEARAAEEEAKQREAEARAAEEEAKQREADAREAEEQKQREAEAREAEEQKQREAEARAAEEEKQREAEARAAEEEERRRAAEAKEAEENRKAAEAEEKAAEDGDTAVSESDKKKAKKKAERKAKRKARKQAAENQAPEPSPDAPKAKPVAEEPIEKQIEEAAEKPASVLPDEVTKSEREQLRAAERKRRQEARKNRRELLGAAGVSAVIGALVPALGGKVVEDEGDRIIVERNGRFYVRKDESALFRESGQNVQIERMRNGRTREIITRPNGSKIITVRDPGGYALRRVKVKRNGERVVLFDIRDQRDRRAVNYDRDLPPLRVTIPQDEYIVSGGRYSRSGLAEILLAPPVEEVQSGYSLRDVRESDRLRSMVRRVDLDTITFDTGSATVRASQVPYLADMAGGMLDVIDQDPAAVFLIEGHTDAVGSELYNLTLSDRRAETVARILVDAFDVPPENLVVEGYGEQYLKINTDADEWRNRRVAIRNITPLLSASSE